MINNETNNSNQQKPNNNFKLNKLFVKNDAKIKTISDNSSLNGILYENYFDNVIFHEVVL